MEGIATVCVCISGFLRNSKIQQEIISLLSQKFNVLLADKNELSESVCCQNGFDDGKPPIIVTLSKAAGHIKAKNSILVLGSETKPALPDITCENAVGVVLSDDKASACLLASRSVPVIACGSSSKDTITYSSLTDETIMVSLCRCLESFSGKTVEPLEFSMKAPESESVYPVLCTAAVLALCDMLQ